MAFIPATKETILTTDETPVTRDVAVSTGMYYFQALARTGTDMKAWMLFVAFKKNEGIVSVLGDATPAVIDGLGDAGLADATVSIETNADNARIVLTGIADTEIEWKISFKQEM